MHAASNRRMLKQSAKKCLSLSLCLSLSRSLRGVRRAAASRLPSSCACAHPRFLSGIVPPSGGFLLKGSAVQESFQLYRVSEHSPCFSSDCSSGTSDMLGSSVSLFLPSFGAEFAKRTRATAPHSPFVRWKRLRALFFYAAREAHVRERALGKEGGTTKVVATAVSVTGFSTEPLYL